jgi:hypothetical protein
MKKLAIRNKKTKELLDVDDMNDGMECPGVAMCDLDDTQALLEASTIFCNPEEYELVEIEYSIEVTKVVSSLEDAYEQEV